MIAHLHMNEAVVSKIGTCNMNGHFSTLLYYLLSAVSSAVSSKEQKGKTNKDCQYGASDDTTDNGSYIPSIGRLPC